jgi:hypothetical protein
VTPGSTGRYPHDPAPLDPRLEVEAGPDREPARKPRVDPHAFAIAGVTVTDRDRDILRSLRDHTYLTTRQVERLHVRDDPSLSDLAATRRTHRYMARLFDLGLVDRLDRRIGGIRAGSAAYIWQLSPAGQRLLGDTSVERRRPTPGWGHLAHALDIAEVVVRLREHERRTGADLVLAVETEPQCWRPYVGDHGGKRWLKPDLRLTLDIGGGELHWFVEVDRGTEHRDALTYKATTYMAAWREGGEQVRAGVFPRVLWIVPNTRRQKVMAELWAATPGLPAAMMTSCLRAQAIDALCEAAR